MDWPGNQPPFCLKARARRTRTHGTTPRSGAVGSKSAQYSASRQPGRLTNGFLAVLEHLHLLQRHEAPRHHPVEHRQEGVHLILAVDDLDDERQVLREAEDLRGMHPAGMPETHAATQHGRPGEMHLARLHHDALVERPAIAAVILADEGSEE